MEGGIRVPAVMRWPAALGAGTKSGQVITVLDLLPTLAAAAGIRHGSAKPLDGENVWEAIRENKPVPRKGLVIGLNDLAVLQGPWKFRQAGPEQELYHLVEDPSETRNLAAEHPELVKELAAHAGPFAEMIASAGGARGGFRGGPPRGRRGPGPGGGPPGNPLLQILDADGDGALSKAEIEGAAEALLKLDTNKNGAVEATELPRPERRIRGRDAPR